MSTSVPKMTAGSATNWSKRTGVSLTRFRDRWEMLKQVPPGSTKDASSSPASNRRVGALQHELMLRASEYFAARPDRDTIASNVGLHDNLFSSVEKVYDFWSLGPAEKGLCGVSVETLPGSNST